MSKVLVRFCDGEDKGQYSVLDSSWILYDRVHDEDCLTTFVEWRSGNKPWTRYRASQIFKGI